METNEDYLNHWFDPLDIDESINLSDICDNYYLMFKEYYTEQMNGKGPEEIKDELTLGSNFLTINMLLTAVEEQSYENCNP